MRRTSEDLAKALESATSPADAVQLGLAIKRGLDVGLSAEGMSTLLKKKAELEAQEKSSQSWPVDDTKARDCDAGL